MIITKKFRKISEESAEYDNNLRNFNKKAKKAISAIEDLIEADKKNGVRYLTTKEYKELEDFINILDYISY